jgi:flagellar biosynthetic protein FliP
MLLLAGLPALAWGQLPALTVTEGADGQTYTLSLQVLLAMTAITLLPALLLTMTSFTRIVIVLGLLRHALGTGQTPSNQILVGLALFMTLFIMSPVLTQIYDSAVTPYMDKQVEAQAAIETAATPLRRFMLDQTRESNIILFGEIAGYKDGFAGPEDVPFTVLVAAFVTSELTTAFQIGFMLFIPFVVIDLVVASVLMSMGMMMLSPMLVSLPFKIMLFVLVDGWSLVMGTLANTFYT